MSRNGPEIGTLPEALRGFREASAGFWRILARPEWADAARSFLGPLPVDAVLHLMRRPGGEGGAAPRAPSGRGGTLAIEAGPRGERILLKALRRGGLPARLGRRFHGQGRLVAEMSILEEAVRRGIPTARLAYGATGRRASGEVVSILATEEIPDAWSLAAILAAPIGGAPDRATRRRALRAAGKALRRSHDLGLDHSDLNIGNLLVSDAAIGGAEGEAWVIDLGVSSLALSLPISRRAANLVRLLRSAEKHLGDDPRRGRDAVSLLEGYLEAAPGAPDAFRPELLRAIRRRLPSIAWHRVGWRLTRQGAPPRGR